MQGYANETRERKMIPIILEVYDLFVINSVAGTSSWNEVYYPYYLLDGLSGYGIYIIVNLEFSVLSKKLLPDDKSCY
jgi:hypothetical protein